MAELQNNTRKFFNDYKLNSKGIHRFTLLMWVHKKNREGKYSVNQGYVIVLKRGNQNHRNRNSGNRGMPVVRFEKQMQHVSFETKIITFRLSMHLCLHSYCQMSQAINLSIFSKTHGIAPDVTGRPSRVCHQFFQHHLLNFVVNNNSRRSLHHLGYKIITGASGSSQAYGSNPRCSGGCGDGGGRMARDA